jgi:uncharacterized protein (TIGR02217 family)
MAFIETPRFPDDIALDGLDGGPAYRTNVVETFSGHEKRTVEWSEQRGRWDVASGIKTPEDFEAVRDMFRMARGRAHGFRFKDWTDYECNHSTGIVEVVNSTTGQLVKRYGSGAQLEDRIITKPIASTVVVKRVRSGTPSTISVTVDATTGGITWADHVEGDTYTWAGEFDVPVRFDTDELRVTATGPRHFDGHRPLLSWDTVPLVEIRVAGVA